MRIALAQINPTTGDIHGNTQLIIHTLKKARAHKVEVIAFPEMVVLGYPAKDLLFYQEVIDANIQALSEILPHTQEYAAVFLGYCAQDPHTKKLYNAYAVFQKGRYTGWGAKVCLPNYNEFDEYRYFLPPEDVQVIQVGSQRIGAVICEDLWHIHDSHPLYPYNPLKRLHAQGLDLLLSLNASPYSLDKHKERTHIISTQARTHSIPIAYVNMWGANDELIFDGGSIFCDHTGTILTTAKHFQEDLLIATLHHRTRLRPAHSSHTILTQEQSIYNALVLAKRDYHRKCGINKSVLGVSGGIDSALSLAIDVEALSKENVLGVISPSCFTSKETLQDAIQVCRNFEVAYKVVPIDTVVQSKRERFLKYLSPTIKNPVTFENQQAIDRMSILRALANEDTRLISGTSNKSELAVGYSTMCGDLHADVLSLGDVYKTQVYALARYLNELHPQSIPTSILTRKPSAELNAHQIDPFDYERLDLFLKLRIDAHLSLKQILQHPTHTGTPFTIQELTHWERLINSSEHKRHTAPLIFKIHSTSFGRDRRVPIAKRSTPHIT